jgi:lactoylglutathione lyase
LKLFRSNVIAPRSVNASISATCACPGHLTVCQRDRTSLKALDKYHLSQRAKQVQIGKITFMNDCQSTIPINDLFEAHLTVTDLERAVAFYKDRLGLPLAHVVPDRGVAFFWIGAPGKAMLGLWETGSMPMSISHVAFQVALSELHAAPERLRRCGIEPTDLAGVPTDAPVVLAWMPAAVYFRDPDNNLLEFITMLPDPPRPDLSVLAWNDWARFPTSAIP